MATKTNATDTGNVSLTVAIGGAAPVSGDTLTITNEAVDYTSGISFDGVDLVKLVVGGKFRGNIGASGAPLTVGVSNGASAIAIFAWAGKVAYIRAGASVGLIDRLEVRPTAGGKVIVTADTVTDAYVFAGSLAFNDLSTCTNLYAKGGTTNLPVVSSASGPTILDARGTANVQLDRDVGTMNVAENATVTVGSTTCSPTAVNLDGGVLNYAGGTITTLTAKGGKIDFSGATADIIITNATIHEGVEIVQPPSGLAVTFTNTPVYIGQNCDRYPGT